MRLVFCLLLLLAECCWGAAWAQRIVSLVPSVTQTYMQMGADEKVVARTSYCPKSLSGNSVVVGDAMTVNVEKILSVKPDVVVTMGLTKPEVIAKLKSLGVKVLELPTPKSFDEICSQTVLLAQYAGCEEDAKALVSSERLKVDSLRMGGRMKKAFFEIGVNPLWAAIPNTYLDEMLRVLNLSNVVSSGNGAISREYVVAAAPDVVVLTSLYGNASNEKSLWRKLLPLSVLVEVDENVACCPTPTNYRMTLQAISDKLK